MFNLPLLKWLWGSIFQWRYKLINSNHCSPFDYKANSLGKLFSAVYLCSLFLFIKAYRLSTGSGISSMLGNRSLYRSPVTTFQRAFSPEVTGPEASNYILNSIMSPQESVSQDFLEGLMFHHHSVFIYRTSCIYYRIFFPLLNVTLIFIMEDNRKPVEKWRKGKMLKIITYKSVLFDEFSIWCFCLNILQVTLGVLDKLLWNHL